MTIFVPSYKLLIILFQISIMARSVREIATLVLLVVTFVLWFIAMVTPGWFVFSVETSLVSLIFNPKSTLLKLILCVILKCINQADKES